MDSSEEDTVIVLGSCFYYSCLIAMDVNGEDYRRGVRSFIGGISPQQAAMGEAKNLFFLSGHSARLERSRV